MSNIMYGVQLWLIATQNSSLNTLANRGGSSESFISKGVILLVNCLLILRCEKTNSRLNI